MRGFRREHSAYAQPGIAPWGFAPWGFAPWGFPAYYGDYGDYYGQWGNYGNGDQAPQVIVVPPQQEAPPPPPPPPPEPARPVTQDYSWPAPASDAANVFSLVSKDGTVRFAIAVWIQDGMLHYIGQDGAAGRLPLADIDREATRRLNATGRLNLSLPPG